MAPVAHSFADPVTGRVHLMLRGQDGAHAALLDGAVRRRSDTEFKAGFYAYAWTEHRSLMNHEWAHVLQLTSYPFLFLRAARSARMMVGPARYLAGHPGRHELPIRFEMDEQWMWSSMLGTFGFVATVMADSVQIDPVAPGTIRRGVLTERDLIEEDATVFEYRSEIAARGRGTAYRNWLRERPHYSRLFSFLAQQFGADGALRVLPMLVRIAYRTTRPLESFFRAFGTVMIEGLPADPEGDATLEELLLEDLRQRLGTIGPGALTMQRPELDDPAGVIEDDAFMELIDGYLQLPIAPLARINLAGTEDQLGVASAALASPWEFFDRRTQLFDERLGDYLPPVITVALDDPQFPAGATLLVVSQLLRDMPFPIEGTTYEDWATSTLKARLMWQAIMDGASGPNARCPHHDCPYHPTGLCHGWMTMPATADDCEFPDFMRYTTHHALSADGLALEPVDAV